MNTKTQKPKAPRHRQPLYRFEARSTAVTHREDVYTQRRLTQLCKFVKRLHDHWMDHNEPAPGQNAVKWLKKHRLVVNINPIPLPTHEPKPAHTRKPAHAAPVRKRVARPVPVPATV